jgi:hypothetical protein
MIKSPLRVMDRALVYLAILLIRAYKLIIAPLWIGGGCRHYPSCSDYAVEALRLKGLRKGSAMAARRIWRCRPGGTFGYDPVEHVN